MNVRARDAAAPLAVLVLMGLTLAAILYLNDGLFTYSLDDPYIHLALAENIAKLHYGINAHEYSSPASSILWPFLLAPFALSAFGAWVPLLISAAATVPATILLQRLLGQAFGEAFPRGEGRRAALAAALALGLNFVGLAFTGMEHSLQVLLALMLAHGLVVEARERRLVWWLAAAIVLGPAVRYENAALSLAALLYLAARGWGREALGLGFAAALPLALFSLFLNGLGLDWLPSSVLVKKGVLPQAGGVGEDGPGLIDLGRLVRSIRYNDNVLKALAVLAALGLLGRRDQAGERLLAGVALFVLLAHIVLADVWRWPRYENYAMAAAGALILYRHRALIARVARRVPGWLTGLAVAAGIGLLFPIDLKYTALTPLAANNIYEQQYQMHRFVTEFYRGPVAVNDLGWVAYRNDRYVLDLWGLADAEAARERLSQTPGWMGRVTARRGIDLAMIYERWLGRFVPPGWAPVARLELGRWRVTPADRVVTFYATRPEAAAGLRELLAAFAATLPAGAKLELVAPAGAVTGGSGT